MGERFLVLIYLITALMVRIVYSTLRKTLPETASQKAPRNAVCLLVLRRMPPITLSRLVREPQRAERPTVCIVTEAAAQVQATDETTRQARHRVCTVCVSATHTPSNIYGAVSAGGGVQRRFCLFRLPTHT